MKGSFTGQPVLARNMLEMSNNGHSYVLQFQQAFFTIPHSVFFSPLLNKTFTLSNLTLPNGTRNPKHLPKSKRILSGCALNMRTFFWKLKTKNKVLITTTVPELIGSKWNPSTKPTFWTLWMVEWEGRSLALESACRGCTVIKGYQFSLDTVEPECWACVETGKWGAKSIWRYRTTRKVPLKINLSSSF